MKLIVTGIEIEIECTRAIKGNDWIKVYNGDAVIAEFRGVSDFSGYELIDGEWSPPTHSDAERIEALEAALLEVILNG